MSCKEGWNLVPKPIRIMLYTVLGAIAAVGFGLLFGWIVVWLWNWLMPLIFGLPTITFWQGVGLFILAKLLFGGFSSHGDNSKSEKKKKKDWDFDWDCEKGMGKFSRWEHYDTWWKAEGKAAFEQFSKAAEDGAPGEAASAEPQEDEEPKDE